MPNIIYLAFFIYLTIKSMITSAHTELPSKAWWSKMRRNYNLGLIMAGITAFILYSILSSSLIAPYDDNFEISLFTILFQGIGYIFMIGIANLFYNLGYFVDKHFNKENDDHFRIRLYNLGYWFSVSLPFSIPLIVVLEYFFMYRK
jgi:hypothetical protein